MAEITPKQWREIKPGDLLWSWAGPVLMMRGGHFFDTPNEELDFDYWEGAKANDLTNRRNYRRTSLSLEPPGAL